MKKLLCGLLAFVMLSLTQVSAETRKDNLLLRDDYPEEYVVVKGDTLWHISGRFLQSPWKWPEVWGVNPQVDNPHLIYPGDVIYLTWVNGKPRLGLRRDSGIYPKARVSPLVQPIPAIPLRDIISFLNDNRVMSEDLLKDAPYVLGGKSKRIIAGAGDRIYARGALLEDQRRQGIYRSANQYEDPDTEEFLGFEMLKIADADVAAQTDDVVTMDIVKSNKEVRVLDRVVPTEEVRIQSIFHPKPSPEGIEGKVLAVLGGVRDGGQFNVVAINRGDREGLEAGHVFAIYRSGEIIKDPVTKEFVTLPKERSGELMVFKVFEKVSYGLIMRSTDVVSIGDEIKQP
ncbi:MULTISPECIES: LysM peptidoglycan-binding domain-containing protein [unclassified Neptuniibacter]|uniref:LysM peptidoglycan-binding domain-containing protein n=1 Tax=unclassified Neptuniibacter TaxID=2630693 RepID=UPI000C628F08|nr:MULTISPECIES: LysM peptidoglycan-binding domain-containing protein [unclassified Neptuniibacter]MAY42673.1 peptidoglycan-binding protein [Oceanospirillaceae bacterium]|tara:strand:- start:32406 stop:33434 length:1029 start_codon:yes stop_codon:yes gene_type:complete